MSKKVMWPKMAAIDIGSNAIRLILAQRTPYGFQVLKKYRFPIRLGGDVFAQGKISEKQLKNSVRAFKKMKNLIVSNKVETLRSVGTSALREAKNSKEFIQLIRKKTGIQIEVIDGVEEAHLIQLAIKKVIQLEKYSCVLLDIGGGSVELTLVRKGMTIAAQSFPFGTVRTIKEIKRRHWQEKHTKKVIDEYQKITQRFLNLNGNKSQFRFVIGTGGNLETIANLNFKITKQTHRVMSITDLNRVITKLSRLSIPERIRRLKLRRDRADVIFPAALITKMVLQSSKTKKIVIPGVGLREGVLWSMTESSIQKILQR